MRERDRPHSLAQRTRRPGARNVPRVKTEFADNGREIHFLRGNKHQCTDDSLSNTGDTDGDVGSGTR